MRKPVVVGIVIALLAAASSARAGTCESNKNLIAGKYFACIQRAWSKRALIDDEASFNFAVGKCDVKLEQKWQKLDGANDGTCSTGDVKLMEAYLKAKAATVAQAVQVGASLFSVGADMSHADLDDLDLSGRSLAGLNLTGASLFYTDLTNADLTGANLTDATMLSTKVGGATFQDAIFTGVMGVGLPSCPAVLPGGWVCLRETLLGPTARVIFTDLSGADLSNLDLHGIRIGFVDLTNANFTNANLTDAYWQNVGCPDGTASSTNGSNPESCCAHMNGHVPASCTP